MLRHMLGIADSRVLVKPGPEFSRNYAACDPNDPLMPQLASIGLVEQYGTRWGYNYWRCTPAGIKAAVDSCVVLKLTRSQRRYHYWIDSGLSESVKFKEFLTHPGLKESRQRAERYGR